MTRPFICLILFLCTACIYPSHEKGVIKSSPRQTAYAPQDVLDMFFGLFAEEEVERSQSLQWIRSHWNDGFIPMILDILSITTHPWHTEHLLDLLEEKTRRDFGLDIHSWLVWLWNKEETILEEYADFKGLLYRHVDPAFESYFLGRAGQSIIRLDEVRWGGVVQDGIPPLRSPAMIGADEADYLEDDHIVFGIEINGEAMAYPKRILAWHEMFTDNIGGTPVAGVYCTLCGTVIIYETRYEGIEFKLGTSGFLYRSNKLMYDEATQSLWNTILGEPVIGPLASKGIRLASRSVVTTDWKTWREFHPDTRVLSLQTGHRRNYEEGEAYREYFSSDELMFPVPETDDRLKNKDEVFVIRTIGFDASPLAISAKFLNQNPIYYNETGGVSFVVLTDISGANRSYASRGIMFQSYDRRSSLVDANGMNWRLEESELVSEDGMRLEQLPGHRAFWFGWHAVFPETRLVK